MLNRLFFKQIDYITSRQEIDREIRFAKSRAEKEIEEEFRLAIERKESAQQQSRLLPSVLKLKEPTPPTVATVKEIHEDFMSVVERHISEEERFLKQALEDNRETYERGERLCELGFGGPECNFYVMHQIRKVELEENLKAKNYFNTKYPKYKFILHKDLLSLCDKYGLFCSDAKQFVAEIPEKNLVEIEKAKNEVKAEDMGHLSHQGTGFYSVLQLEEEEMTSAGIAPFRVVANLECFSEWAQQSLKKQRVASTIPDPIVLMPVANGRHAGYLIVTAWGDEASLPEVVNEKMN